MGCAVSVLAGSVHVKCMHDFLMLSPTALSFSRLAIKKTYHPATARIANLISRPHQLRTMSSDLNIETKDIKTASGVNLDASQKTLVGIVLDASEPP